MLLKAFRPPNPTLHLLFAIRSIDYKWSSVTGATMAINQCCLWRFRTFHHLQSSHLFSLSSYQCVCSQCGPTVAGRDSDFVPLLCLLNRSNLQSADRSCTTAATPPPSPLSVPSLRNTLPGHRFCTPIGAVHVLFSNRGDHKTRNLPLDVCVRGIYVCECGQIARINGISVFLGRPLMSTRCNLQEIPDVILIFLAAIETKTCACRR
uniref:Uncharacterized protein n=1 Tax=Steinernema glaseri TaxID=37863 RepID=A0A1I8A8T2_9BILA